MSKIKSLMSQTGGVCIYCGHPLLEGEANVDHIIPLSKGGLNEPDNRVACCCACNSAKGSMMPLKFLSTMRIHQQRGYVNRVETLFSQKMISREKRDLLLYEGSPRGSRSWTFSLLHWQIKVWLIVRRNDP